MGFSNQFTWSKSRAGAFDQCERKYFMHYFAYWNGWKPDAPERQRRLYKLRSLQNQYSWAGIVVHDVMAHALSTVRTRGRGAMPSLTDSLARAYQTINDQWAYSESKRYWSERRKAPGWFGLVDHELNLDVSPHLAHRVFTNVSTALINIYESDILADILTSDTSKWVNIEQRSYFYLDGVKVWTVPDFMYVAQDNYTEIVDWKTGKRNSADPIQLGGYVAYAHLEHEIPLDQIRAKLVYTSGDCVTTETITPTMDTLRAFADYARTSMARMDQRLVDKGTMEATRQANEPLPIASFPKTTDTFKCNTCCFRDECANDA